MTSPESPTENPRILETSSRLSKSILWNLQREAYCRLGPGAWSRKGVPFYITSNPYIAHQYAQVVWGYLKDCLQQSFLDPQQPVFIFDLGAGSGRFAYLFLKSLNGILSSLPHSNLHIRYIMTDIASANILFWETHPYLQDLIRCQTIDFAYFSHSGKKNEIKTVLNEEILTQETIHNPIVVIGNYFFDTIPQDLFLAKNRSILEGRVTLSVEQNDNTCHLADDDPDLIHYLKLAFDYAPIENLSNYYPDNPLLGNILKNYAEKFDNIPFLFPEGAFKVIDFFAELSNHRMLLLAADQGRCTEEQLVRHASPFLAKHFSFSFDVNYHAIATYFSRIGGTSLLTSYPEPNLAVTASLLGPSSSNFAETRLSFKCYVDNFEPNDYYRLLHLTEKEWSVPSIEFILLLIKMGHFDHYPFYHYFQLIRDNLPRSEISVREKLAAFIMKVLHQFFPVGKEEAGYVMNLGVLLCDLHYWKEAMECFDRAIEINPSMALIYENMAICLENLQEHDSAIKFRQKALELKLGAIK